MSNHQEVLKDDAAPAGPGRQKPISKQYTYGVWEFGEFSEARAE